MEHAASRPRRTYAATIRQTLAHQRMSLRQLAHATDFSYEHLRKLTAGHPVGSRACNVAICTALGLNEPEMWELALAEKQDRRLSSISAVERTEPDVSLARVWVHLTESERARLVQIAGGWLAARD